MTHITNTKEEYGWVAVTFHWVVAALIFFQLGLGLYMADLPNSLQKLKLFGLHKEFGLLILLLVILRVLWRFANITPILPEHMPSWQKIAAHGAHFGLYVCMILMPVTGWLISSAAGLSISFFGLFVVPAIIPPNEALQSLSATSHTVIAYILMFLIALHICAVIQHLLIYKDNILKRMLY